MDTFEISGSIDGVAQTIRWEEGVFLLDPGAVVTTRIVRGTPCDLTPTGPTVISAAAPAEVAIQTALACFDDRNVALDAPGQALLMAVVDAANVDVPDDAVT